MTAAREWLAATGFVAASVVAALGITYAAEAAPAESAGDTRREAISIGVDTRSAEQMIIGEIYNQVFLALGRESGVNAVKFRDTASAVDIVQEGRADLALTCTGLILHQLDPAAATALAEELGGADKVTGAAAASEKTYAAAVGTLPGSVMTVDPSPAQGCSSSTKAGRNEGALPQSIIPVFEKSLLTRRELQRLNFITRVLSTKDIEEMAQDVEAGTPVREAVSTWLMEYASISVSDEKKDDQTEATQQQPPV